MVRIVRLSPGFAVAPQLVAEDFPAIAAEGFKAIIGNRPDGEQPGQLSAADAERLAKVNGMEFRYLPLVMPMVLEAATLDALETLTGTLPGPVLAYCRSGTRSATAWAGMASRTQPADKIVATLRAGGYEAAGLEDALNARKK